MKKCGLCQLDKPLEDFHSHARTRDRLQTYCKQCSREYRKTWSADNKESIAEYSRREKRKPGYKEYNQRYRQKIKAEAFAAYGGCCKCCGESEIRFLNIDHTYEDGSKHRREIGHYNIYAWLKREGYPQDGRFQILCYNCNMAKYFYGECPHNGRT